MREPVCIARSAHVVSGTREPPLECALGNQTSSSLSVMDILFILVVLVWLEQRGEGWVENLEFLLCSALSRFTVVSCR